VSVTAGEIGSLSLPAVSTVVSVSVFAPEERETWYVQVVSFDAGVIRRPFKRTNAPVSFVPAIVTGLMAEVTGLDTVGGAGRVVSR
jgi:hypothetical protein